MDTESIDDRVTDLLDEHIPRRSPQYAPAHAFAVACLTTDAATQRLVRKLLREDSPDPEPTDAAPPPAAEVAPESGEIVSPAPAPTVKAVLSCGGKACETKGGIDVHRMDASCSKFVTTKKTAAR